jgi:FixJ family two-component response regulator
VAALRQKQNPMPAILITAHPDTKILERASAAGITLIKKPFQQAALLDCIDRLLS